MRTKQYYEIWGELASRNIPVTDELVNALLKIRRLARKHDRLAEMDCNGEGYVKGKFYRCDGSTPGAYLPDGETTIFDAESEKVQDRIKGLVYLFNQGKYAIKLPERLKVEFQGDPRGYTVKLALA